MRKLIVSALVLFAAVGYADTLTTNSALILPLPEVVISAERVAATAYIQGQYATVLGTPCVCVIAGTSQTNNTMTWAGGDITDGTVTWRPTLRKPRKGMHISNTGTNVVYLNLGGKAVSGKYIYLPIGGSFSLTGEECSDFEVHGISAAPGPATTAQKEW